MELRRAKIISVTSSKGGIGKSVFITNLAGIYEMLGKKVFLSTYVKTIDNWRDREKCLTEFGLNELE